MKHLYDNLTDKDTFSSMYNNILEFSQSILCDP